jgi:hypothetical protein
MQDILMNPEKYGAPTFAQFCKHKQDNEGKEDQKRYIAVQDGATSINWLVEKQKYFYLDSKGKRFKCKNLEEIERIAKSEGVSPRDLDYKPELIPQTTDKCHIHVTFFRKPYLPGFIIP